MKVRPPLARAFAQMQTHSFPNSIRMAIAQLFKVYEIVSDLKLGRQSHVFNLFRRFQHFQRFRRFRRFLSDATQRDANKPTTSRHQIVTMSSAAKESNVHN